jgi:hypothetical protein
VLIPKPDLRRLVDAIQQETQLAAEALTPLVGTVSYEVEQTLRQIITRAVERGMDLQREALGDSAQDDIDTPMRPAPSEEPPTVKMPRPSKVPKD